MKTKFAIIGGGVAGLCAAIRLCELGEEPILIEGGSYPAHKICGEFLSPECIPHLNDWNIHPVPISQAVLKTSTNSLVLPFPIPAGGLSHLQLDPKLADYALRCGAKIKTNSQVVSLQPKKHSKDFHQIHLSNDEPMEASNVIVATGRIPNYSSNPPKMAYMGFKAHFEMIRSKENSLEMFSFPGAYLGIAPIEDNKYNVACLADLNTVGEDPQLFIERLINQNPFLFSKLSQGRKLFEQWMVAPVPAFGIKQTPEWIDAYFIGDAAMTIPPACGNGLSMAIIGGRLCAEFATRKQAQAFKAIWTKQCSSQMFWAKLLHKAMLNPGIGNPLIRVSRYFPSMSTKVYELTRQPPAKGAERTF